MSKISTLLLVLVCLTIGSPSAVASDLEYVPGELIVQFAPKPDGNQRSLSEKNQILSSLGGATINRSSRYVPGLTLVKLPEGTSVESALATFSTSAKITQHYASIRLLPSVFCRLFSDFCVPFRGGQLASSIEYPASSIQSPITTHQSQIVQNFQTFHINFCKFLYSF